MAIQERALLQLQQVCERAAAATGAAEKLAEEAQRKLRDTQEQLRCSQAQVQEAAASLDALALQRSQVHARSCHTNCSYTAKQHTNLMYGNVLDLTQATFWKSCQYSIWCNFLEIMSIQYLVQVLQCK